MNSTKYDLLGLSFPTMKNNSEFCYYNYAMSFCEYYMIYEDKPEQ